MLSFFCHSLSFLRCQCCGDAERLPTFIISADRTLDSSAPSIAQRFAVSSCGDAERCLRQAGLAACSGDLKSERLRLALARSATSYQEFKVMQA
jgi:hypothetical protein